MGTAHHDGRARLLAAGTGSIGTGVAHLHDEHLQPLVVTVVLVGGALVALAGVALLVVVGQLRLNTVADLDDGEVWSTLQHGAGDQVANTACELLIDVLAPRLAHQGGNYPLGVLRGNAAHIGRRHIALLEFGVLAGLGVGLAYRHQLVHVDLARLAIDGDRGVPLQVQDALIALGQRLLQPLNEVKLIDFALMGQRLQCLDQF